MKSILLSYIVFLLSLNMWGQEPESFSYQAVIHNSRGELVTGKSISLRISVIRGSALDSLVYSEKHSAKTSQTGLVSVEIGEGTDKTGDFTSIDWNDDKYFLKVEADATGGSDYNEIGTTQILSIPDAMESKKQNKSPMGVEEDKLFISRRYIGTFLDYRQTGPHNFNGPNIIWIKTSMDDIFGKISAYGKKCNFSVGDKLYLKRVYYSPGGIFGYWVYRIENDSSVYYRVSDYQYDHKVYINTWFN